MSYIFLIYFAKLGIKYFTFITFLFKIHITKPPSLKPTFPIYEALKRATIKQYSIVLYK